LDHADLEHAGGNGKASVRALDRQSWEVHIGFL
jgi:hypothetical protein